VVRSERFELPTLGIEIRCSIQLSYERLIRFDELASVVAAAGQLVTQTSSHLAAYFSSLSGRPFRVALAQIAFTTHSAWVPTFNPFNRRLPMRLPLSAIVAAGSLVVAVAAFAQSTSPATPPTPAATATPAVPVNPAAAVPVSSGKRFACQAASQGFKGQERQDQMQLCMAQARLDCLKEAIDQKIVGPPRRDFVKSCVQDLPE
jgi:hypothetical protein